jgi:hypothetical protein
VFERGIDRRGDNPEERRARRASYRLLGWSCTVRRVPDGQTPSGLPAGSFGMKTTQVHGLGREAVREWDVYSRPRGAGTRASDGGVGAWDGG